MNKAIFYRVFVYLILILPISVFSSEQTVLNESVKLEITINSFIEKENKDTFYGLSSYYDNINYYIVDKDQIYKIDSKKTIQLKKSQWLAAVGRFNVFLIKKEGLSIHLDSDKLIFNNPAIFNSSTTFTKTISKSELASISPELDQIRYYHLWSPIAWLAKLIESILVVIQTYIVNSWGIVIIVFAVFLKILLLPIGIMTTNFQRKVSQVQSSLEPKLVEIKEKYDGEEAHNRLMAAHKNLKVSPFYTLKPFLGYFVQIPILIAVFNALGEMPQFAGQSFLWIETLAYPDVVGRLSFVIPMLGDTINLLPFIMTTVALYSTIIFQNRYLSEIEVRRQKRNLYFMAVVFFILFYPFPSVVVLYWILTNILQTIQQQFIKI